MYRWGGGDERLGKKNQKEEPGEKNEKGKEKGRKITLKHGEKALKMHVFGLWPPKMFAGGGGIFRKKNESQKGGGGEMFEMPKMYTPVVFAPRYSYQIGIQELVHTYGVIFII